MEVNNTITDFGILVGNAVDTQINDISITEDYNYVSSYVNPRLHNAFSMVGDSGKTLYALTETASTDGTKYTYTKYAEQVSAITETKTSRTFVINGTTYYLFVDNTKENPYSYSLTNNLATAIEIVNNEFQITAGDGNPLYCIDRNDVYKKVSGEQTPISISSRFTLNGVDYATYMAN